MTYVIDTMPLIHICKFIVSNMFTLILQMVRPEILKVNAFLIGLRLLHERITC